MSGWIKLHRKILDSPLWKDCNNNQRLLMVTLLLMANHESNRWIFNGMEYEVKPGQMITSLKSLSEATGLSISAIRCSLVKLEKYGFCSNVSSKQNRLITIVNWRKYQDVDNFTAKVTANEQQTNSKRTATNKNDKNDKNDKNNIYSANEELNSKPKTRSIKDYSDEFKILWNLYPKKKGKVTKDSEKEVLKNFDLVKEAILIYKEDIRINKTQEQYIMHGSTFFNGRWREFIGGDSNGCAREDNSTNQNKGYDFDKDIIG